MGEATTVEDGFLHASHEAEAKFLADLADFAKETKVEDQGLVAAATEKIEQFIHDQKQAKIGELLVEGVHHLLKAGFILANLVSRRELVINTPLGEALLQMAGDDFPERHFGGTDLQTDDLELANDDRGGFADFVVGEERQQVGILGDGGDDRHQVRFASAVVADNEQATVVLGLDPAVRAQRAALRAGFVVAGVVGKVNVVAGFAGKGTPAQCRGAAMSNRPDGAALLRRERRLRILELRQKSAQRPHDSGALGHRGCEKFWLGWQAFAKLIDQSQSVLTGLVS